MVETRPAFRIRRSLGFASGFTLVELVIAMAIVGVLATLIFPSLTKMRDRAERTVCIGNLRSLYVSLSTYLTDHKRWPEVPPDLPLDQVPKFWVNTLKDYGATESVWRCPSLKRRYSEKPSDFLNYPTIHYMPAQFGPEPAAPHRYPAQPWIIEMASLHGDGNMLMRADGGLRHFNDLLKEAGDNPVHQLQ